MIRIIITLILCASLLFCLSSCNPPEDSDTQKQTSASANQKADGIFNTRNVKSITFYGYYGFGTGSVVSSKDMPEIINWLDSFTVGEAAPEQVPPGTNTYTIRIFYYDGSAIEAGLDTVSINGITYYTESADAPDCFWDIISKSNLV